MVLLRRELHGMQVAEPSEAAVRQSPLYKDLERRVSVRLCYLKCLCYLQYRWCL
jgi:hypothetical protein